MKNLKVSIKLILSFVILIVLAVAIGVIGIIGMNSLKSAEADLYNYNLTAIEAMGNLRELFANERNAMRTIILHQDDPDRVQTNLNNFAAYEQAALEEFATYEATITNPEEEAAYYTAKEVWLGDYANMKDRCLGMIRAGQFDEAYQTYVTEGAPIIAPLTNGLAESAEYNNSLAEGSMGNGEQLFTMLTTVLIAALAVAIAAALFLALYISNLISKPMTFLAKTMTDLANTGNFNMDSSTEQQITGFRQRKDESGQISEAYALVIDMMNNKLTALEAVSKGDLTAEIAIRSADDSYGNAIQSMVDNLSTMFGNINTSTKQVSTGAKQVADGAQALAQGATEQAASIQQLSSSIAEIAESTKANAATADKTARLSDEIKANAERGSLQMDDMIQAVKQINEASQSISKIIKTIDDIAFQTNILALNAAVEAARAGQHGKGFAVVAEEVRNLASKSAEAAKDTGDMIQNSMEKAEFGSKIAGETATSLKDIVIGINESGQFISEIARASEAQSQGISQINTGIDQVAQVVQQNSATAEQSAAASQEMSGQSDMLQQLISQFKLKDDQSAYKSLAAPGNGGRRQPALGAGSADSAGYSNGNITDFGKY